MRAAQTKLQSKKIGQWLAEADIYSKTKITPNNYAWNITLTKVLLAFTTLAWLAVTWETGEILIDRIREGKIGLITEQVLFIVIIQGLIYGNFIYQLTRLGYLRRRLENKPLSAVNLETIYDTDAPKLAILVPSYKEETSIVKRTLLSAALQDYPNRRIVLLLDNPPNPDNAWDQRALKEVRNLPKELQALFNKAALPFQQAQREFNIRFTQGGLDIAAEAQNLANLYENAAYWLENFAESHAFSDHGDHLLIDKVFKRAAFAHIARAKELRLLGTLALQQRITREYNRLAALFCVEFTIFERKQFENLSHESNKAMNLNSYIRLLGRSWKTVKYEDGNYLIESEPNSSTLNVPEADFLITLDADSLLLPEYALVMVNEMIRAGNERLAVAQTPYNTIPSPTSDLERIAGATTDIQYLIHQGFTQYGATYWVGANALLRVTALMDIKTTIQERNFPMPLFIQDRTVIEDTESSIDLVARGWKLYNYPERLAFSATPPDFGSLLIQRLRWANGGLIILPKLLRYLMRRPSLAKAKEGFFRVHYLSSIAVVNIGLLILLGHSFEESIDGFLLPLTALPYFALFALDLRYNGYRYRDLVAVYALNLLLIPINIGGVLKSMEQAITKKRIPFKRTPKVSGRTASPMIFILSEYALVAWLMLGFYFNIDQGHNASAAFCLINAALLAYAIVRFIGLKESLEDIRACLGSIRSR
jgi:cellulose synthase/poly-beta-1,6-N-acetylglucosamine synthase-like glycosyltransferase